MKDPEASPPNSLVVSCAVNMLHLMFQYACLQGARKTKLGLREFVTLGDFCQTIDTNTNRAVRSATLRVNEQCNRFHQIQWALKGANHAALP